MVGVNQRKLPVQLAGQGEIGEGQIRGRRCVAGLPLLAASCVRLRGRVAWGRPTRRRRGAACRWSGRPWAAADVCRCPVAEPLGPAAAVPCATVRRGRRAAAACCVDVLCWAGLLRVELSRRAGMDEQNRAARVRFIGDFFSEGQLCPFLSLIHVI